MPDPDDETREFTQRLFTDPDDPEPAPELTPLPPNDDSAAMRAFVARLFTHSDR